MLLIVENLLFEKTAFSILQAALTNYRSLKIIFRIATYELESSMFKKLVIFHFYYELGHRSSRAFWSFAILTFLVEVVVVFISVGQDTPKSDQSWKKVIHRITF